MTSQEEVTKLAVKSFSKLRLAGKLVGASFGILFFFMDAKDLKAGFDGKGEKFGDDFDGIFGALLEKGYQDAMGPLVEDLAESGLKHGGKPLGEALRGARLNAEMAGRDANEGGPSTTSQLRVSKFRIGSVNPSAPAAPAPKGWWHRLWKSIID